MPPGSAPSVSVPLSVRQWRRWMANPSGQQAGASEHHSPVGSDGLHQLLRRFSKSKAVSPRSPVPKARNRLWAALQKLVTKEAKSQRGTPHRTRQPCSQCLTDTVTGCAHQRRRQIAAGTLTQFGTGPFKLKVDGGAIECYSMCNAWTSIPMDAHSDG